MRTRMIIGVIALSGILSTMHPVMADDAKPAGAVLSAEEAAMMKEWAKWSSPGDHHKHLEKLVGKWDLATKMWMDPSAPPMESKGIADNTMIIGGRWLRSEVKSEMMGQPFEGLGMTGYDNFKGAYVSTWVDNVSTAMMQSTGTCSAEGKEFAFSGTMDEPMTGERGKKFRSAMKWTGADSYVWEAFDNIPGKGEVRVMEITYTRSK